MQNQNNYSTASLSANLIHELKAMEDKLNKQTDKEVILIAYEKNSTLA